MTIALTSESAISIRWSPALHALVHYGISGFASQFAPFYKTDKSPDIRESMYIPKEKSGNIGNHGDHHSAGVALKHPINVKMFGDGHQDNKTLTRPLELDLNLSALNVHLCLSDKQNVKFYLTPLR